MDQTALPKSSARGSGIVRPARRPSGWRAPGPAPATPANSAHVWPQEGEDLCYLSGDWRILQRIEGHRWSLDDLVTAWAAADEMRNRPPRRVLDIGCGIGTVLLMMAWRFPEAQLLGVEAQDVSVDLARRSIAWNGAEHRCAVRPGDLRDPAVLREGRVFDLVTGTPPYLPPGTAMESNRIQVDPCHIERRGGVEEYCRAAARVLAPAGRFVVCAGAAQGARVRDAASGVGLAVTRSLQVIPRAGKAALFSVYVMRNEAENFKAERTEPPLVVRDGTGKRTKAFVAVRRDMGMPP
jgi:tRNA1(Val) A37 N6-methylase TrmN6